MMENPHMRMMKTRERREFEGIVQPIYWHRHKQVMCIDVGLNKFCTFSCFFLSIFKFNQTNFVFFLFSFFLIFF